jgi:hypothetical protein
MMIQWMSSMTALNAITEENLTWYIRTARTEYAGEEQQKDNVTMVALQGWHAH